MDEPVLIAMVVVSEVALHYFRWREVLQGHELPRLMAYGLGSLGLMLPFTWWLALNNPAKAEIIRVLWMVMMAGGLSVVLCWGLDWIVDLMWRMKGSAQREQALREGIHATEKGQD
jgi:hypothetical protein